MWYKIITRAKIINMQINTCRLDILGLNICMLTKQLKQIRSEVNTSVDDLNDGDTLLVYVDFNPREMKLKICDSEIKMKYEEAAWSV